jgi:ATP-binding cassette subfamily B protein/ATP-binding cassette subfamily C protein
MPEPKKLTSRQQVRAIAGVARISFKIAPWAVVFKLAGAIIDATLPIATTFFAAKTTTLLVSAYGGDAHAGRQAIIYVVITALLGLLMTVWRSVDNVVQAKTRYIVGAKISDNMYQHFLSLDFWRYDDKKTVDLYDRAEKFSQFFAFVFDRIASVFAQFFAAITAIVALMFVNVWLGIFMLVALSPGVYVQFKLSRQQIQHWNENIEIRRAQNMLEWQLSRPDMIAEMRLYGIVRHILSLRRKYRDMDERARVDFERQYLPKQLLTDALQAISEVSALIWIAVQVANRHQPVGQFLYVQQIVSRAIGSAGDFITTLGSIDEDIANLYDYEEFMALPTIKSTGPEIADMPQSIFLDDVSFNYPGTDNKALDGVTFHINKNQHVAIVGENGAGKSTLIKLLTGLYHPTAGQIMLDDVRLEDINVSSWHRYLGILQQSFNSYAFATAGDNVRFGDVSGQHSPERLEAALKKAEADKFIAKLPKGADTYVNNWMEDDGGVKGVELSGGQWQRLALARDFYRDAPVIILDEPTSAIDALAEARIFKHLFADKNRTVITISHRLSTIEKADVIYMLEDGKLVESGTHKELVAKRGRYYRLFESQIESETK